MPTPRQSLIALAIGLALGLSSTGAEAARHHSKKPAKAKHSTRAAKSKKAPPVAAPAKAEETSQTSEAAMQLDKSVTPTAYAVELTVNPNRESHIGNVKIDLKLAAATNQIRLSARDLKIGMAELTPAGGHPQRAVVERDSEHTVILRFKRSLPAGTAKLEMAFSGHIESKDTDGLFRQKDGNEWYAFTQFEATGARSAFPCFDEPGWKTPWTLSLRVPQDHVAVANSPMVSETPVEKGWKIVRFAPTKPLPTYLVAFGVGRFDVVDGGSLRDMPIRFITPKGRGPDARYAAEVTASIVDRLERYFGMPYPYEKLDSMVLPLTVGFGAMENAGLITYRSSLMLAAPEFETAHFKRDYVAVAAHELAHQWFGNLVTMKWWDDLWLNESFASWMGDKITDQVKPEWNWGVESAYARANAMQADRLASARKIRQPVTTYHDLGNAFDGITYSKGQAMLTMIESWMGPEKFRDGVRRYMKTHAWGNATAEDFIKAVAGDSPKVAASFRSLIDQPGIPRLDLTSRCDNGNTRLSIKQSRWGGGNQHWTLPFCYSADGAATKCEVIETPQTEITLAGCPIVLDANPGGVGYYRPIYPKGGLMALLDGPIDSKNLNGLLATLDDVQAQFNSGDLPATEALAIAERYAAHPRREVVEQTTEIVEAAERLLEAKQRPAFAALVRKIYGPRLAALGLDEKPGESDDDQMLRANLIRLIGKLGDDPQLAQEATRRARSWLADRKAIAGSLVEPILVAAARHGDASLFDALVKAVRTSKDRAELRRLYQALGSFSDPVRAAAARKLTLAPELDPREAMTILSEGGRDSLLAADTWAFLQSNFDELAKRLPRDYPAGFPHKVSHLCEAGARQELASFMGKRADKYEGGPRDLALALESIDQCLATRKQQSASLASIFGQS